MTYVLLAIGSTLVYASPLIFAALGGVISERSGVVNIGLEGMMTIGACLAVAGAYYTGNPWTGFLCGGLAGAALALLHAFASVSLNADQTISGVAINLIGAGLALFLARMFFDGATQTPPVPNKMPRILSGLFPEGGNEQVKLAFNQDAAVLLAFASVAILWFFLYRTKWGLRVRSVGEHPAAAETVGVNVRLIRYVCVLVSGLLAGFGGATMSLSVVSLFTPTIISGHGYIALAAVIFGRWTPHGAFGACLIFGFAQVLVILLGGGAMKVDSTILSLIPYVLTLGILVLMRGKIIAPKADGVPYERGA
ncbi:MAG: ABC transporter permease [Clostridiales Family XIII bacterium]|jgi:simple sugar transport system permease protein|nr:ABC transporter permease [Clostridiales Family XIII bacterium]